MQCEGGAPSVAAEVSRSQGWLALTKLGKREFITTGLFGYSVLSGSEVKYTYV